MSVAVTNTGTLADPAPKLKLDQSSAAGSNPAAILNSSGPFTMTLWARYQGIGAGDALAVPYRDIISIRNSDSGGGAGVDQIIGLVAHGLSDPDFRVVSVGDVDSDADGAIGIPYNEWHHFAWVCEEVPNPATNIRQIGYMDGVEHTRSADNEMTPPVFPANLCWIQLFNSRSSDSDGTGVYIGYLSGLKIWNAALTPDEIRKEMWSFLPVRTKDIFACNPLTTRESAVNDLIHATPWTVQGADIITSTLEPPGVQWAPTWTYRNSANFMGSAPSATLGGDALDNITEGDIVAGGKVITITLNGATWISAS